MWASNSKVNTNNHRNRRRFPRYVPPVKLSAVFKTGDTWIEGEVGVLGQGGSLLVILDGSAPENEGAVTIKISEAFLHAKGRIRSVFPGAGFGIEFVDISPENRELLDEYCDNLRHHKKAESA